MAGVGFAALLTAAVVAPPAAAKAPLAALALPPTASVPAPLPAPEPALPSIHWAYMVGHALAPSLADHAAQIDYLSPAWFQVTASGTIAGQDSLAVSGFARSHGIKLVPVVANGAFSPAVAHALVTDGQLQTRMLNSIQTLVQNYGYDGINLDFENVSASDAAGLSALMYNLSRRLHSIGKLMTVALPSQTHPTSSGWAGAFSYAAIAPNVDFAVLMAYDQHYAGGPPGPIADVAWVSDVIRYAETAFTPGQLLLGVPLYGYNWNLSRGGANPVTYSDVVQQVFAHGARIHMVGAAESPMFQYSAGDGLHQVWFEDSTSLQAKLNLAANKGLAGWAAWRLGQEDPNFWSLPLTQLSQTH